MLAEFSQSPRIQSIVAKSGCSSVEELLSRNEQQEANLNQSKNTNLNGMNTSNRSKATASNVSKAPNGTMASSI